MPYLFNPNMDGSGGSGGSDSSVLSKLTLAGEIDALSESYEQPLTEVHFTAGELAAGDIVQIEGSFIPLTAGSGGWATIQAGPNEWSDPLLVNGQVATLADHSSGVARYWSGPPGAGSSIHAMSLVYEPGYGIWTTGDSHTAAFTGDWSLLLYAWIENCRIAYAIHIQIIREVSP